MNHLHFLHIPRTGGTARRQALKGKPGIIFSDHDTRMSDVRPEDTPVIFWRDPVERFISSWPLIRDNTRHLTGHISSIEEAARALPAMAEMFEEERISLLRPQVWWFDAIRPDAIVGPYDEMEDILRSVLPFDFDLPAVNESREGFELSKSATAEVLDFYDEDIDLILRAEDTVG
jgi:hypothetical protein